MKISEIQGLTFFYAHIKVVVAFLVVNFFGFSVITRDHGGFEGCHQVEMDPTGLPELSKPFRAQNFKDKTEKMKFQNFEKNRKN